LILPRLRGRGTAEGGGGGGHTRDALQDILQTFIAQNIRRRNSHHSDVSCSKPIITSLIVSRLIGASVRCAINFDCQLGSGAKEVQNIWAYRVLPPELKTRETAASNTLPQDHFGQRHFPAQRASAFERQNWCAHPPPPPCFAWSPSPAARVRIN
jgi:hypothetical protein